jgi:hypothetical protein
VTGGPTNDFKSESCATTNDKKKPAQSLFHSKRVHTITKMNGNMNMENTIAGAMNICCINGLFT